MASKRAGPLVVTLLTASRAGRSALGRIDDLRFLEDVHASGKSFKRLGLLLDLGDSQGHRRRAGPLVVTLLTASRAGRSALGCLNDLRFLEDVHAAGKSFKRSGDKGASPGVVGHLLARGARHA